MVRIIQRNFANGVASGVRLQAHSMSRKFVFGNKWSYLRIGILAAVSDYGYNANPSGLRFNIGVCTNFQSYGGYSDALQNKHSYVVDPTAFPGGVGNIDNFAYTANSGLPYYTMSSPNTYLIYRYGSANSYSTTYLGTPQGFYLASTEGTVQRRTPYIITISKGLLGTNYAVSHSIPAVGQLNLDCTYSEFMELMNNCTSSPYGSVTTSSNTATLTPQVQVSEYAWGPLDSLEISWSSHHLGLEVYAATVLRYC